MAKLKLSSSKEIIEDLRKFLSKHTGCEIQSGIVKGKHKDWGWCCGTCFMSLLDKIGLDSSSPEYKESNKPKDRHNEVWRAILQIRSKKIPKRNKKIK